MAKKVVSKKVTDSFNIRFDPSSDYEFICWKIIDTVSKKETTGVINNFLNEHKEFSLLKDKMYFPYKKYGGSYYFAILKKEGSND